MGIILMPILLYYIGESDFLRESIYESYWDINIPPDFKQIYHNQDQHDFQGKGIRYTLFVTKETSTLPLINFSKNTKEIQTIDGSSSDGRNYDIEEFVQTVASDLNIPENDKPNFDEYYIWQKFAKYGNTLIVLYFPNANKVYFVEKLI
jgi:hypothetical protein